MYLELDIQHFCYKIGFFHCDLDPKVCQKYTDVYSGVNVKNARHCYALKMFSE